MNAIQQVATSAAHAVWKQRYSIRIEKVGSMSTVNKEWEEALRWIASWDEAVLLQQQQQQNHGVVEMPSYNLGRIDELWRQVYSSVLDDKREDFTAFVNDLARLLQTCIDTCLKDEGFDIWIDEEDGDGSDPGMDLVGDLATQSFFSWAFRDSLALPFRISHENDGLVHRTIQFVASGATRLLAASLVVYLVHCLRTGLPLLSYTYDFFGSIHESLVGKDESSPAWLIEHEKEVEMAKKSRQQKNSSKKSKRKGSNKKQSSQQQPSANTVGWKSNSPHITKTSASQEFTSDEHPKYVKDDDSNDRWESYYRRPQPYSNKEEKVMLSSSAPMKKDIDDMTDDNPDGVPSSISISTSSCTTSNNDQSDYRTMSSSVTLDGHSSPSTPHLNHHIRRQPNIMNSPPRKPLLVPTEEQRNEAAQKLRDFQNAQIQRLMQQKKLSQSLKLTSNSAPTFTSNASKSPLSSSFNAPNAKVVQPPPGFVQTTNTQINQTIPEDHFFAQNELLLSKLLDDDDTLDDALSADSDVDSFPQESSLDPSAAPFVLEGFDATDAGVSFQPKKSADCEPKWGADRSSSDSLGVNGRVTVKGVYGGSVW